LNKYLCAGIPLIFLLSSVSAYVARADDDDDKDPDSNPDSGDDSDAKPTDKITWQNKSENAWTVTVVNSSMDGHVWPNNNAGINTPGGTPLKLALTGISTPTTLSRENPKATIGAGKTAQVELKNSDKGRKKTIRLCFADKFDKHQATFTFYVTGNTEPGSRKAKIFLDSAVFVGDTDVNEAIKYNQSLNKEGKFVRSPGSVVILAKP